MISLFLLSYLELVVFQNHIVMMKWFVITVDTFYALLIFFVLLYSNEWVSIEKKKDKLFYYYDRLKQNAQLSTMSSLPVKDNK